MVGPKGTLGVDALAYTWPRALLYAFPPFPLLPAVLARVRMLRARVLLVTPDWLHQPWMTELVTKLAGIPWHLPARLDMLSQARACCGIRTLGFTGCMFGPWAIQRSRCSSYDDSAGSQRLYAGRWNRFCGWCHSRGEDPVSCGASVVLAFLHSLLESGLSV